MTGGTRTDGSCPIEHLDRMRADLNQAWALLVVADLIHRTALASLHDEFADVITTDEATARLGG
jgi:hypothetical protein